jgi:hypothetical protein
LEAAKADSDGLVQSLTEGLSIRVSRQAISRAIRIADTFVKALAGRGWDMDIVGAFSRSDFAGIKISFSIEESMSTEQREPPPDLSGSHYSFHHNRRQEIQRKPSGRLTLSLREQPRFGSQTRRNWHDSEKRPLEDMLNDVVVGMLRLAAALRVEVAQRQKAEREAMERQRQLQLGYDTGGEERRDGVSTTDVFVRRAASI